MANNILQQVVTYNKANLAFLLNQFFFIHKSNKKFKDFDKNIPMNRGAQVSFDIAPRFTTVNSLVIASEPAEQRVQTLAVDQEISTSYDFTAQDFIFNVKDYMQRFGKAATLEIGTKIESNVAQVARTVPYRFFGDGVTPISTPAQLDNMVAQFQDYGASKDDLCAVLSRRTYPGIRNAMFNQFASMRNEKILKKSWEIGEFAGCDWYSSNLLPVHNAGTEGNAASVLTVVSVVKNADDAVTAITFSGTAAGGDANSIKQFDKGIFSDGISGKQDLRFRTFVGHEVCENNVTFSAASDAASTGGNEVTIQLTEPLKASSGKNQNINTEIVEGMQATILPSHRCGLMMSGNPLYLAMPMLPDEDPFKTSAAFDQDSGCSIRQYYGSDFGRNKRRMVHDAIWGKTMIADNAMMIALPL